MSGTAPVAELTDVSLRYGEVAALDRITLSLPAGRMVGLIGPDGVGKSSLLSLVAGARAVQQGGVRVLGSDMRDKSQRDQLCPRIAYMPQGLGKNLYPTLSVAENLQFFGGLFGHSAAEQRRRIARLTASTGLAPFLERPAGKLSGGMKQKLGLCCALIHDPDLLILDEPTTGVDPLSRAQFWDLIADIRAQRPQMSVIVATAYMDEANRFDWLVAMDGGKVLATGAPQELQQRTGSGSLEEAFIALLPEAKRSQHQPVRIPPLEAGAGQSIAIEANGLTMRFGDFVAVDNVDFRIRRGEIFGFLGSNGCGKSTTMKMLTGLLPASAGSAKLFGQVVDPRDLATRRRVGYMSQAFSLYGELTVMQNLVLHARLFSVPEPEIAGRVQELAQRFGLEDVVNSLPEQLPLGIRQRLSLAVAMVHRPELLILDEPTSGVDPVARDMFWQLMIDLARRDQVTIFISTHFMNEAERCDRISLMHAGRVLVSAAPAELVRMRGADTLEQAFIAYLEDAARADVTPGAAADSASDAAAGVAADATADASADATACATADAAACATADATADAAADATACATANAAAGVAADATADASADATADSAAGATADSTACATADAAACATADAAANATADATADSAAGATADSTACATADAAAFATADAAACATADSAAGSTADATAGAAADARAVAGDSAGTHACTDARAGAAAEGAAGAPQSASAEAPAITLAAAPGVAPRRWRQRLRRALSYTRRETLELRRDPVRATLALLGTLILMCIIGYGINLDVDHLNFAVLDRDQSALSQAYAQNLAGSRYFIERPALADYAELDRRMRSGELALAIELPPGFGRDLQRGAPVSVGAWVDGAMPLRAETTRGYVQAAHLNWLQDMATRRLGVHLATPGAIETRYRYNPDVRSLPAMIPAVIPLLLMMIPAMLAALSVVREKELGSILNLYVTPVGRAEFLLGKQLPYIALGMLNFVLLTLVAQTVFGVPLKGSFAALSVAALLYVVCATGFGLLISTFTRSQIAALFFTMIGTLIPCVQFAGLINPVSALEGVGALIGRVYPATHFLAISRGVFNKALGLGDLQQAFAMLALALPVILLSAIALLKKQEA